MGDSESTSPAGCPPSDEPQRRLALEVVRTLRDAGHEALWAGGCVRDQLLGVRPKDYDVATAATPHRVREVFGQRRTIPVGAAFGVITVLGRGRDAGQIEVATFRTDGDYADGRRPESVRYATPEEDASRRDFTINGLFYDPLANRVIDYVEGRADLTRRVVRAIGDPDARFGEDRLRMLRAVRFAASLGFELDASTTDAVRRHAPAIVEVSGERIGAEVKRMLTERDPPRAVQLLADLGLLARVLPLPEGTAAARRLAGLAPAPTPALALATALLGEADAATAAAAARTLKWTAKEAERVRWLIANADALAGAVERPWSEVQPLLAHDGGAELVTLATIGGLDVASQIYCEERLTWPTERLDPPPLLVGADLIRAGQRPGPELGAALARVRAAQLDAVVSDRESALRLLGLG